MDLKSMVDEITGGARIPAFAATAYYDRRMDALMYLKEDCSYVAERIGSYLTVLWHPQRPNEPVGLKLKGFGHLFNKLVEVGAMDEESFEFFIKWLESVLAITAVETLEEIKKARIRETVPKIRELVQGVRIPRRDIEEARQAA